MPDLGLPFKVIGLTGGIASGKSVVAELLRRHGAAIVDSDVLAREVVAPGQPAFEEIVERFGPGVVQADGALDRRSLASMVFSNPARRAELEAITHPRVRERARAEIERLAALPDGQRPRFVVQVVPLLFEVGLAGEFDEVWVVACDPALQVARLQARDEISVADARARLAAQWPLERKLEAADRVVWNTGSLEELEGRLLALLEEAGLV